MQERNNSTRVKTILNKSN